MPTNGMTERWAKSSHSGGGNDCVETRIAPGTRVTAFAEVRDTKDREAGSLTVSRSAWQAFLIRVA